MSWFGKSASAIGGISSAGQQAALPQTSASAGSGLISQGMYGQPYYGGLSAATSSIYINPLIGNTTVKNFTVSAIENGYIIQFGSKQYVTMNEFCDVGSFINDLLGKDKAMNLLK